MRTNRVLVAGIVLLGVLAIGSTAASYDTAESMSVSGGGEGEGSGSGSALPGAQQGGAGETIPLPGWVVENLLLLTFGLGTLCFVVGSIAITWIRGLDGLKRVLSMLGETVASGVLYVVVVGFLVWLTFGFTGEGIELMDAASNPTSGAGGASGGSEATGTDGRSVPYWYVLVAFWILLGVGWFYLFDRGGGDESAGTGRGAEEPDGAAAPDARVPTREAISDVPPSNPVYSAWREMASEAEDATDGTLTANEVAAAADERGLDREAVRALTRLFEEVRYGDRPVTEDRERRAKSALESIDGSGGRGT